MAYNNLISRTESQALVPENVSTDILKNLEYQSAALALSRKTTMGTNQTRMPVLAALPTAYFVNGDTGLKQTTEVNWDNKYLNAEELAAIVPIPENVLDDASYDIWGNVRPLLEQAAGRALDAAVFFGVNKPASWPSDIATAAAAAGNTIQRGTNAAAAGGLAGDISDTMATVEADGFTNTGVVTQRAYLGRFRQVRSTQGERLLDVDLNGKMVEGAPYQISMDGLWPTGSGAAELFSGDFSNSIIAVRKDFTYKILDQAVIQDATGTIIYNLAQQDMLALRMTYRVAWQVANTINYSQAVEANRYPWAILHAA
jgi:HK97 family phage major capsid protein